MSFISSKFGIKKSIENFNVTTTAVHPLQIALNTAFDTIEEIKLTDDIIRSGEVNDYNGNIDLDSITQNVNNNNVVVTIYRININSLHGIEWPNNGNRIRYSVTDNNNNVYSIFFLKIINLIQIL